MNEKEYKQHIESVCISLGEYIGDKWHLIEARDGLGLVIWHLVNIEENSVKHNHAQYELDILIDEFVKLEPWKGND